MGWLRYFVAAIGAGLSVAHADVQPMLKYWWVMPEGGEKGEEYASAYNDAEVAALLKESALIEARVARQEALRQEALKLMRELRKQGKSALVAYEEAWTQVYSNRWLDAHWQTGSCKLEDMLTRLASDDKNLELTPEEQQWVLEALLEADDRLDSKLGRDLLRNLVSHLRALGYGKNGAAGSKRDLLMNQFADGLATGMDSRAAYREAMFKVNRDRIMCHTDTGYLAPWGVHVGDAPRYRQAPLIAATTLGSGSGYASGILEGFLAKSPADSGLEDDDEKKKDEEEDDELQAGGASAVAAAPMSGGAASSPRFAMRALPPPASAPTRAAQLVWTGSDSNEWTAAGDTSADSPWENGASFANGSPVLFEDTDSSRDVLITGTVAPGVITVNANTASGTSGSGTAVLKYGYAFTSDRPQSSSYALTSHSLSCIADYVDEAGRVTPTSILNNGSALLILNTRNTFSGGVKLAEGASLYLGCDYAAGTGTITMNNNTTLVVNYHSSDEALRIPSVENQLDVTGTVKITQGTGSYGENRMPTDWRTLTLSGGITGSGTLNLSGYSFMVKPEDNTAGDITFNYVSAIAVNESQAGSGYLAENRFAGTVKLKNEICNQPENTLEYPKVTAHGSKIKHVGGAIQLTLSDDIFSKANLDLTRDINANRTIGDQQGPKGGTGPAQTSDNILLLSEASSISVVSLDAEFLGQGFVYNLHNNDMMITSYRSNYEQQYERWHVRIVTDSNTTLKLGSATDSGTHTYDGSMGFAHSYVQAGQAYIHAPSDPKKGTPVMEPTIPGAGSLGLEALSLEKSGPSTQYIHSANLDTLSLQGGTLGFNYLNLNGYLNLTSGTTLMLGVGVARNPQNTVTGWTIIDEGDYQTNSVVTIQPGKELLVMAADDGGKTVNVSGSITMSSGSDIMFNVLRPELGITPETALMQITGSLTFGADVPINVSFSSADFARKVNNQEHVYYLVSTGSGINSSGFQRRYVPVGHGYYGLLDIKDSKYLVLNVIGDPSRTWSGNITNDPASTGVWTASPVIDKNVIDYTWKENHKFVHGVVTLFGNLYVPTEWKEGNWDASSLKTSVVSDASHPGIKVPVTIDGLLYSEQYQKVEIVGDVAPATVSINADYLQNGVSLKDGTDYYFYGSGYIRDALNTEIQFEGFKANAQTGPWKTTLIKSGTGTAVIATANTFSGGSLLEGGRLVMQNAAALGDKTGRITVQNGVILQGDFADDRSVGTWGDAYLGEGMATTTILNPVYVGIYVDGDGVISTSAVDARIMGAHDKKLVLTSLSGGAETVVALYGNSLTPTEKDGKFTYSVFKVLDPSNFYGTIKMDGNLRGASEGAAGGNVQLEIMTTTKSDDGADWLNTKVDFSLENGTSRTVLALDALSTASAADQQTAEVDSLNGAGNAGARINSSVLSMSHDKIITLKLMGMNAGNYDGVLGFGDFQRTTDYGSNTTHGGASSHGDVGEVEVGAVAHHFGGKGKAGEMNVLKLGGATQSVNSAWLNELNVGETANDGKITTGGTFVVDEGLVVSSLNTVDGSHVVVGDTSRAGTHALTVGAGGILAFDSGSTDAFAGIGAGIPSRYVSEVIGGNEIVKQLPPESFVQLVDGATISAYGDWWTNRVRRELIDGKSTDIEVGIDIAIGATVTFNTHNYTPDAYITASNDVFGNYNASYVIQLLGAMKGSNVDLIFNNELISAAAQADGSAVKRADGLGYTGATGTEMGYVGIRDIHQFTGDITVTDKTVLQVRDAYDVSANQVAEPELMAEVVDTLSVRVEGTDAAIQFTDGATMQYMEDVFMADGGQVLLGGAMKTTSGDGIKALDMTGVDAAVTHRTADEAHVNNLKLANSGTSVSMGGFDDIRSNATNARISTHGATTHLALNDMNLRGSLVQLHDNCSLNLEDAVLVDMNSVVRGAKVNEAALTVSPVAEPSPAADNTTTTSQATRVELTFSDNRGVYDVGNSKVLVLQTEQFLGVDVTGGGLTLQLTADSADFQIWAHALGAEYVAIQIGGGAGQFLYEDAAKAAGDAFDDLIDNQFVLLGADNQKLDGFWISSVTVQHETGANHVSTHMIYFRIPEPTTTTLSLMALTALCLRRRRK